MKVYNICEEEISKFTSLSKDNTNFRRTIESLWKDGVSTPEWCFVIEQESKIVGRIGYWASPDNPEDIRVFGLLLPWEREDLQAIGLKLLKESLQKMKKQGSKYVNYQLHSDETKSLGSIKQILELIGMKQIQAKKSFSISNKLYKVGTKNRLSYKSLQEVGKDLFIEIIKKVTKGTLDQEDKLSISNLGEQKNAENYFEILKTIDFSVENWLVGYAGKNIIGLVVPQKIRDNLGTINYIGVIPDERGQAYVMDLLNKGIKNLFSRNIENITADIDESNFPMENALLQIGFIENKKILVYRMAL